MVLALSGPAEAKEAAFLQALSAAAKSAGTPPLVVGWTRAAVLKVRSDVAAGKLSSQLGKALPAAEVYGVGGTAPGNVAMALALAGARGIRTASSTGGPARAGGR